jgi:hypothetical protein
MSQNTWESSGYRDVTTDEQKAAGEQIIEMVEAKPNNPYFRTAFMLPAKRKITKILNFPPYAVSLQISQNRLTTLPPLPETLEKLDCMENRITSLPPLPAKIKTIQAYSNRLVSLPELPASLERLSVDVNLLTLLPSLPPGLKSLSCSANKLTEIPPLPSGLTYFACAENNLTSLPELPKELKDLQCNNCNLKVLPTLPSTLESLTISGNHLESLPELPKQLRFLYFRNNPIALDGEKAAAALASFPLLPEKLERFDPGQPFIEFFKEPLGKDYQMILDAYQQIERRQFVPQERWDEMMVLDRSKLISIFVNVVNQYLNQVRFKYAISGIKNSNTSAMARVLAVGPNKGPVGNIYKFLGSYPQSSNKKGGRRVKRRISKTLRKKYGRHRTRKSSK